MNTAWTTEDSLGLTELGRLMRPLLEQTVAAAAAVTENASRFKRSEEATLRIGQPPNISAGIIATPLGEVLRRTPALQIELQMGESDALAESLLQGEAEADPRGFDDAAIRRRRPAHRRAASMRLCS